MSFPGRINIYTCNECRGEMVTIDAGPQSMDTPIHTKCLLTVVKKNGSGMQQAARCGGRAHGSQYICDQRRVAQFQWVAESPHHLAVLPDQLVLEPRGMS